MIDSHVHLRDGLLSEKETIAHGGLAAYDAGFTALFDMPNTDPPLVSARAVLERLDYADTALKGAGARLFYAVYGGITADLQQIEDITACYRLHFPRIAGFKMFAGHSTGRMGITEREEQRCVYAALTRLGYTGVLAVHCEKEAYIDDTAFNIGRPETHSTARPPNAETESIKDQIALARETGFQGHIHVCHISTAEGIRIVKEAKEQGFGISCGATAHHALLNTSAYSKYGIFAKMNPPLRSEADRAAVFKELLAGGVDWIESDHAPHTAADKQRGASGVPGFAGSLLLVRALRQAGCSEKRLTELCGASVNRVFGLQLPFTVPSDEVINAAVPALRSAYEYDIFG